MIVTDAGLGVHVGFGVGVAGIGVGVAGIGVGVGGIGVGVGGGGPGFVDVVGLGPGVGLLPCPPKEHNRKSPIRICVAQIRTRPAIAGQ